MGSVSISTDMATGLVLVCFHIKETQYTSDYKFSFCALIFTMSFIQNLHDKVIALSCYIMNALLCI